MTGIPTWDEAVAFARDQALFNWNAIYIIREIRPDGSVRETFGSDNEQESRANFEAGIAGGFGTGTCAYLATFGSGPDLECKVDEAGKATVYEWTEDRTGAWSDRIRKPAQEG
jgi:hypothetical protein